MCTDEIAQNHSIADTELLSNLRVCEVGVDLELDDLPASLRQLFDCCTNHVVAFFLFDDTLGTGSIVALHVKLFFGHVGHSVGGSLVPFIGNVAGYSIKISERVTYLDSGAVA